MKKLLAFCLVAFLAANVNAGSIEYRILIDGVDAPSHVLPAGQYTLRVEGVVTENDIPGAGPGGFLQASYDLLRDSDAVSFVEGTGFLGAPSGTWDSSANDAFLQNNRGVLDGEGNVIQETNGVLQSSWNTRFADVGAGQFSFISEGPIEWDGSRTTTIDLRSTPDVNLRAVLGNAAIAAALPDGNVIGDSVTLLVPEPASAMLAGLAMFAVATSRRRK